MIVTYVIFYVEEPTIRLVGGKTQREGRVEVYYEREWGTVCDDSWDLDDAMVVCRQLGYNKAIQASRTAYDGKGSGKIRMREVRCAGIENTLQECQFSRLTDGYCSHEEDAGVRCGKTIVLL